MFLSVRTLKHLLPTLLFLIAILPRQAQSQEPRSAWWYPLGNPEGTRNNPAPTASQKAEELKIKWRTDALKNSPVLLVGSIRTEQGSNDQQVVGVEEGRDRVTILKATGLIDQVLTPIEGAPAGSRLQLTGLFNTTAPSVTPFGKPNAIGLGIADWPVSQGATPFGLFVDGTGNVINRLGLRNNDIAKLLSYSAQENRIVTISPVAAYTPSGETTPVAVAITSQSHFILNVSEGETDSMINSVRKYSLVQGRPRFLADSLGVPFYLAPDPSYSPPAFYVTGNSTYISLSTRRYSTISPPLLLRNGIDLNTTSSEIAAPLHLNISASVPERIAYEPVLVAGALGSTSLFATLLVTESTPPYTPKETPLRFFMEQSVSDGNAPRLQLTPPTAQGAIDNFLPVGNPSQTGWLPVIADVDGTAPAGISAELVNNPGNELILTSQPDGSGGNGKNWIYIFRRNFKTLTNGLPFNYFTRQLVSGKVVASGDLVHDQYGRQELLLAQDNMLYVLQLKPYDMSDDIQNPFGDDKNTPFYFLDTFALDSPILSVAVADLEGDGENDIVVCTQGFTYAIGKVQPDPYSFDDNPNPFKEYCSDDRIEIGWKRNVGGENEVLDVTIVGQETFGPLAQSQIGNDMLSFTPATDLPLPAGTYRIVVNNESYPYIADTSAEFTIVESAISGFDFTNTTPYTIGTTVTDDIRLQCVESAWIERSMGDSTHWSVTSDTVIKTDETNARFSAIIPCPALLGCGTTQEQTDTIYYRIVSRTDTTSARAVPVTIPNFPISLESPASLARNRTLTWNATDIPCSTLSVSVSGDNGKNWITVDNNVERGDQTYTFEIPPSISGSVLLCVQCNDPNECGYGVQRFTVSRVDMSNYVYPNPFDPEAPGGKGEGAEIVYSLKNSGIVSITIYDPSRSVVREVIRSEERPEGRNRGNFWDGKNSDGEYVANGTYICVVSSSRGEQIILPIAVVKRR